MTNSKQKVVNTKSVLTAPNLKRLGAFLIDYIILYFVLAIAITSLQSAYDFEGASTGMQVLLYVLLIIVSLFYFTIVPVFFYRGDLKGSTIGKKLMGLRMIRVNGTDVTLVTLLIRSLFALLGEGLVMIASLYVLEIFGLLGMPASFAGYITTVYVMVTLVSATIMIIRPSRQMFHDYIANTIVILTKQGKE